MNHPHSPRLAGQNVYHERLALLEQLPGAFSLAELRQAGELSLSAAAQTCRYWRDLGRIDPAGRGFFLKPGKCFALPLAVHRTAAAGPEGYLSGRGALAHHRLTLPWPKQVDWITILRRESPLPWQGWEIRRHWLKRSEWPEGISSFRDGGRVFRIADPERVVLDALQFPEALLPTADLFLLARNQKNRLHQGRLAELALCCGSEAAWRRLRVLADVAEMRRLAATLAREPGPHPGMGRTLLQPEAPPGDRSPVHHGVLVNVEIVADLLAKSIPGDCG